MDDFEIELKRDFLQEASQGLSQAEQAFLSLESDPKNPDLLNQIFRLAHNLKGTSRAVGFGEIAEFTHSFENLILKIKDGSVAPEPQVISLLLRCNDRVSEMINELKGNLSATFDNAAMIAQMEEALAGKLQAVASQTNQQASEPVAKSTEATPEHDHQHPVASPAHDDSAKIVIPVKKNVQANADESIRVSLQKVETLNNLVGELVLLQSVLVQHGSDMNSSVAGKSLAQLSKLSKELHEAAMGLRMIPIKQTLQKMHRIVRDTSQALSKTVDLRLEGEETEIDKTVLEHINDPLVHIVRNAVDHGLESTEDRLAVGKSSTGVVRIRCFHEGNFLVIEISDDGKGINPEVIRSKAIAKGLIPENNQLTNEQLIDLIFHPGFSTKEQVSEISGRGVGMDVVRTNIRNLNGSISIRSEVGKGSVFRVSLPLTMAVIEGLVVGAGAEKYVLPLTQVHETLRLQQGVVDTITDRSEVFTLRGKSMPLFRLQATLQRPPREKQDNCAVIITRVGNHEYGILVDEIFHQQQIVVKKLGPEIQKQKGFMGSSILGDGKPSIIVDLHKLYEHTNRSAVA